MQYYLISIIVLALCFCSSTQAQAGTVPFCVYYANIVTSGNQVALINATINAAITGLVGDSRTAPWFNGVNNNAGKNFSAPAHGADLVTLHDHLVGFFGGKLGCNDSAFATAETNTGPFNPSLVGNLETIHAKKTSSSGNFVLPVTATAFDAFNEIVTGFLLGAGVAPADLLGVSGFLTGTFRTPATGATSGNILCQDTATCDSSFEVALGSKGFFPSKIVIDSGSALALKLTGTHNVVSAPSLANTANCTGGTTALGASIPATSLPVGTNYFIDTSTCTPGTTTGSNAGYLVVVVVAPAPPPTTANPTTSSSSSSSSSPTTSSGSSSPATSTNSAVAREITLVSLFVLVLALLFV